MIERNQYYFASEIDRRWTKRTFSQNELNEKENIHLITAWHFTPMDTEISFDVPYVTFFFSF